MPIHPTAIVDPSAKIADSACIGPYTIVGPEVEIGARTEMKAHSMNTKMKRCLPRKQRKAFNIAMLDRFLPKMPGLNTLRRTTS